MRNKAARTRFFLLLIILSLPSLLFADDLPPFDGESPYGVTDVQVPIDNGVFVLVAIAVAYGLMKTFQYKKSKKNFSVI